MRRLLPLLLFAFACDEATTPGPVDQGTPPPSVDAAAPDQGFGLDADAESASDSGGPRDGGSEDLEDAGIDAALDAEPAADAEVGVDAAADAGPTRLSLRVITFNTGSSGIATHDSPPDDGYTSAEAQITEDYYGHGLSWLPVIADTQAFLTTTAPDIVAFQEIFYSGECATMAPEGIAPGFVCDGWSAGQPTVAQQILDAGWQIACNLEKPDKCLAVRLSFGSFRGCTQSLCLDGLEGARVQDCGGGSRIGRGTINLVDGSTLTVVNVHGSSGILAADQECREQQYEQVFRDLGLGDGEPAANGTRNIVLGDFNTDPVRHTLFDSSARRLEDFVGGSEPFQYISEVGSNATPTYAGLFNIDHVISDHFIGSCWAAGITGGHPPVTTIEYFDHVPLVCDLVEP